MALETYLKDDDAFLLPHLVLPQGTIMGATTIDPPRDAAPLTAQKNKNTNKNEPRRETALKFLVTIPNRHREAALKFLATLSISNSSLSPVPEVPLPELDDFDARAADTENCVDDQEPSAPDGPAD